jgi:excisionase family DNA binding protein
LSNDEILTADEAATLLKVSTKTVLKLARDGDLPAQKVGRAWRFSRSELVAHVACAAPVGADA